MCFLRPFLSSKFMKYEITITPKEETNNNLSFSLDTASGGSFDIKSYGTTLNFEQFVEFADAIHEIRQKFAVLTSNNSNDETVEA